MQGGPFKGWPKLHVYVKRRFNGIVPAAVGAQDVLDRTANGTFAAALGTLVVGAGLYFGRGIRRAGHKAAQRHGSQVVQVVAAVGDLLAGITVFGKKILQKVRLVGDVLVNIGDLQVGGADGPGQLSVVGGAGLPVRFITPSEYERA